MIEICSCFFTLVLHFMLDLLRYQFVNIDFCIVVSLMFPLTKTETKISVNENNMNSLMETKTETEIFVERKTETKTEKAQIKKTT